jgi:hypothetical protein
MNGHQILTKVHFHYNPEVLQWNKNLIVNLYILLI